MGITTNLKGREKYRALKAHRLAEYCKTYRGVLAGTDTMEHLDQRLNKLIAIDSSQDEKNIKNN